MERNQQKRQSAASRIQKAWIGYKNRQMFRLLKATIRAAEQSLTQEILRKVVPKEADFFRNDSFVQLKLRFRFGGCEYPPLILYKVYLDTSCCKVKYVNGKRAIQAHSDAATQAARMMGNRKYYDLMLQDCLHRLQNGVVDECDVTTMKDHMHLLAVLDETQAEYGGKGNGWRQLTSRTSPRYTVFRDVVEFLATRRMTDRLLAHLPLLTALPSSQEIRREQLRILAEVEGPQLVTRPRLPKQPALTGRRTRKALSRSEQMRAAYLQQPDNSPSASFVSADPADGSLGSQRQHPGALYKYGDLGGFAQYEGVGGEEGEEEDEEEEEEDFEEAEMLYEWTKELTMEQLASPRLNPS